MKDRKVYELTYPAQPVGQDTTTTKQKAVKLKKRRGPILVVKQPKKTLKYMEQYTLPHDIHVMYVTAATFPDGVMAAHQQLHRLTDGKGQRKYFGLSRPEGGKGIVYRAAAEELSAGEANALGLDTYTIEKGVYTSQYISNFMNDLPAIGKAFSELLQTPGLDPNGI